ncbi:alpha/beta hydrolase [Amycolatopsis sp. H20-H5]|uniref:alpha/beta hydrolase n=1 Tax=Amycolatopsis sp. H20-H5 TaxID=3046309 RepID=UPI002DBD81FC|nr:alpha/beta hydrolase family protein [Amycolatopsis sp. H20-H5]MEC3976437.1 alpha/beta hydrolase family protein [Amycolatopsis sp. H20-H5]
MIGARPGTGPAVVSRQVLGPRLVEYTLDSPVLGETTSLRILFPTGYGAEPDVRFPVLYLLHGGDDDYRSWTDKGEAAETTEPLPMIVVMPDARNGFYSNWEKAGRHGRTPWESFHLGELLPWVDRTFRTLAQRESRAAAGLSMGGFGAFSYAARHPDLFVAAASFSGVLDTNRHPWITEIAGRRDGGGFGAIWGDRLTRSIRWRAHNPWDLAENLRGSVLFVRTGNGVPGEFDHGLAPDPVEAIVFHQSTRLHKRLTALGIDHDWHHGRGTHDWPYWIRDLRETAPLLAGVFADPPPAPSPFTFTSAEPEFEAWGWRVSFSRQHKEFTILSDVDEHGFGLARSGAPTVRTAPRYEPGEEYKVRVDDPSGSRSATSRADRGGHLTFPLKLGPGGTARVEIGATR